MGRLTFAPQLPRGIASPLTWLRRLLSGNERRLRWSALQPALWPEVRRQAIAKWAVRRAAVVRESRVSEREVEQRGTCGGLDWPRLTAAFSQVSGLGVSRGREFWPGDSHPRARDVIRHPSGFVSGVGDVQVILWRGAPNERSRQAS